MCGDVRAALDSLVADRFDCVVTSPPYYWQRDYGQDGQIGLEPTIAGYVCAIADSMEAVRRVLTNRGTVFLNIADTYYSAKGKPKGADKKNSARRFGLRAVDAPGLGVPRKTVIGIPWRVALAMIERGWVLRAPIIWRREAPMPEPTARDRPWRTYEMVFMFSKSPRYYFDRDRLKGGGGYLDYFIAPEDESDGTSGDVSGGASGEMLRRRLSTGRACTRPVCGDRHDASSSREIWPFRDGSGHQAGVL